MEEVKSIIQKFIDERNRENLNHRYTSFDFCYNYFYHNRSNLVGGNLQESCLQLWAFLASWGMIVRGNELQGKSYVALSDVVKYINKHSEYYDLEIEDKYYIKKVLDLYEGIDKALNFTEQKNRKTLITKIILGVYACCPAFDSRFCTTFSLSSQGHLTEKNLQVVVDFYRKHKKQIDSFNIPTEVLPFEKKGKMESLFYTPAKIVDMYGFERNKKIKE